MRRSAVLLFVLLLGACTQGVPPLNFSVPNVQASARKVPAEVKSITVALARAQEQETIFQPGQETLTPIWKTALEEALNNSAIFQDDASTKVSVAVKILKIDVPALGVTFPVTTAALYQVVNRQTGAVLYSERIETVGTVPSDFAFLGLARARESVNRSVQANIARFVERVPSIQVPLPSFSAGTALPSNNMPPRS